MAFDLALALRIFAKDEGHNDTVRAATKEQAKLTDANEKVNKSGRQAGRGLQEGSGGAKRFRNEARQLNRESKSLGRSLSQVSRVVGGLAGLFGGISLALIIGDMTQAIFLAEQLGASLLSSVGGIPELAQSAFLALEQFAAYTPFALDQSIQAFIKLQNLGIRPTEERMRGFGNLTSAMGKDLNQIAEAVADAATGEFERLKEFGIKASKEGDLVRFMFRGVTTSIKNDSEAITQYLTDIGNNQFGDAMQNQMERLPGLWSNLKDGIDGIWRDLGDEGITAAMERWVAAAGGQVNNLRQRIKAGWFDWFSAQLSALASRLSGWTELAGQSWDALKQIAFAGYQFLADNVYGPLYELLSGKELLEGEDGIAKYAQAGISLIADAFDDLADLPDNLRAIVRIGIGEFEKFRIGAIENFQLLGINASLAWENLGFSVASVLRTMELAAARSIEFIIQQYGSMVTQVAAALNAINNTSLGDNLVPDGLLAKIEQTGAAMESYSSLSENVAQKIAAGNAEHEATVAALEAERVAVIDTADLRRDAAQDFIDDALAQRESSIEARAAQILEAEATAAAAEATYELNLAKDAEKVSLDAVTAALAEETTATQENEKAKAANADALGKLLDRLDPAAKLSRDYAADLAVLNIALDTGSISQAYFNQQVANLDASATAARAGLVKNAETMEGAWLNSMDRMADAGVSWLRELVNTGEISFNNVKGMFLDMVQDMLFAAKNNPISLAVGASGSSGLATAADAVSGGSSGGGLSDISSLSSLSNLISGGTVTQTLARPFVAAADLLYKAGFENAASSVTNYMSSLAEQGGSFGLAGGLAINVGAGIVGAYAGNAVGESVTDKQANSAIATTIGATIGSFILPGIGTLIGSFVGSLVDVFSGSRSEKSLSLGISAGTDPSVKDKHITERAIADSGLELSAISRHLGEEGRDAAKTMLESFLELDAVLTGTTTAAGRAVNLTGVTLAGSHPDAGKDRATGFFGSSEFNEVSQAQLEAAPGQFAKDWIKAVSESFDAELAGVVNSLSGSAEVIIADYQASLQLFDLFGYGDQVFDDVAGFTETIAILNSQFREVDGSLLDAIGAINGGVAVLQLLGQETERTVEGLSSAQAVWTELARESESAADTLNRLAQAAALMEAFSGDATTTVDRLLEGQAIIDRLGSEISGNILRSISALGGGLREQFAELNAVAAQSSRDIYETQVANVRLLIGAYDGSAAASAALADATIARRQSELALLGELETATDSMLGRINSFREQLTLDGLDEQGQYNRYRDQIAELFTDLESAGTASEVDRVTGEIDRLARAAYGVLDDGQQNSVRAELLEFLDQVEFQGQFQLGTIRNEVADTSATLDTETIDAIWSKAGLAGETLQAAGEVISDAAAKLDTASDNLVAASTELRNVQRNKPTVRPRATEDIALD